eukprot:TRINITY_DN10296_c1_g1_i1.p1 TRINITY_DN10296_c1_g1~~TRINITY_DN10296_c1_g1_i1.p1  ORF type:complete len:1184 (+),score=409.38 TRINITY_DN10296_c1_g1_i1:94-3645(+)
MAIYPPEALQQLVAAAKCAYTSTNPVERKAAEDYIQAAKHDSGRGVAHLGFHLVPPSAPPDPCVTHFALHLLEHAVEQHWNSYADEERAQWRQALLQAAQAAAQAAEGTYGPMLRRKLAAVIASVAIREWPQRWPELLPFLGAAWAAGGTPRAVALQCLAELADAAVSSQYRDQCAHDRSGGGPAQRWDMLQLAQRRKLEVTQGIRDHAETLLGMCHSLARELLQKPDQGGEGGELSCCIGLMEALASLLHCGLLLRSGAADVWGQLLQHPQLCSQSAELVQLVLERADPQEPRQGISPQEAEREGSALLGFVGGLLQYTLQYVRQAGGITAAQFDSDPGRVEARHSFARRLAQIVDTVRKNNKLFAAVVARAELRQGLWDLAAALLSHEAAVLHCSGAELCEALLADSVPAPDGGQSDDFWIPLLRALRSPHLVKSAGQPDAESRTSATKRYASLDFDDSYEVFLMHYAATTSAVRRVTQRLAAKRPGACLAFMAEAAGAVMAGRPGLEEWACTDTALGYMGESMPRAAISQLPQQAQQAIDALAKLCSHDVTDLALAPKYVGLLQTLSSVLGAAFPQLWEPVVRRLLNISASLAAQPSPDAAAARRKAQNALIYLAQSCGAHMVSQLPAVLGAWRGVLQRGPAAQAGAGDARLCDHELSLLTEAASLLSNCLPPQQRQAVLAEMVAPCLPRWEQLTRVFTPAAFAELVVRVAAEGEMAGDGSAAELRRTLSLLHGVYRRCSAAQGGPAAAELAGLSHRIFGPLLQCIAALHTLCDPPPEVAATGHGALLAGVADSDPLEDPKVQGPTAQQQRPQQQRDPVAPARLYVSQLRISAYGLLGSLCSFGTLPYDSFAEVQKYVFGRGVSSLPTMSLKSFFLDLCAPLLLLCPEQHLPTVLPQLANPLWKFFFDRLSTGWSQWHQRYSANGSVPPRGSAGSSTEDAEKKQLSDVSEDIAGFLSHAAMVAAGAEVGCTRLKRYVRDSDRDAAVISGSCRALMKTGALVTSVMPLLGAFLLWPSTPAAMKATEALNKSASEGGCALAPAAMTHVVGCALHRVHQLRVQSCRTKRGTKDTALLEACCHVIADVYFALRGLSTQPAELLARAGVPPQAIATLEARLEKDGRCPQKRRQIIRELLNPAKARDAREVRDLPEYDLLRPRRGAAPGGPEIGAMVPLSDFFAAA